MGSSVQLLIQDYSQVLYLSALVLSAIFLKANKKQQKQQPRITQQTSLLDV